MIKKPQSQKADAGKKHMLFIFPCILLLFSLSGCKQTTTENRLLTEKASPSAQTAAGSADRDFRKEENLVQLYQEIYEETIRNQAYANEASNNLTIVQEITQKLGERGITAIDSENQVNMSNPQQMYDFISALKNKGTAEITVLIVSAYDRFTEYRLHAESGALNADKTYYQYVDGAFENRSSVSFPVDSWHYTDEGYFLFAGKSFSAQSLVLTMSDEAEFAAWRVAPLAAQCREWTRRYLLPVGYGKNNMFLTDWNETDYGTLDFYDLFDKFYPEMFQQPVPYTASENAAVGAVYHIPAKEFENVISLHFTVDSETLRDKTDYLEAANAYEYRPRGFYEVEYPNLPYPEVISGTEHEDGTLTLLVNAVYPGMETSRAFTHELIIRPDAQAGFQYVSNRVLPSEQDYDTGWHTDRLTEEAWENVYGETSLLSEEEQDKLEADVLAAAKRVSSVFSDAASTSSNDFSRLTAQQCETAVSLLGKAGFVSVSEDIPMEHPEQLEAFYRDYQENRDAQVTVLNVNANGVIDALTFLHENGKLQTYYIGIRLSADGTPQKTDGSLRDLTEIQLTPKGYFIYAYKELPQYAALCQYWRIRPLSEQCLKLTEKYVRYLSYVNYNLLMANWDEHNAESILTPNLYEDLCRIHTGKEPEVKNGRIPAAQYEEIMTRYLPVTEEQVQRLCGYDEATDSYPYEMTLHRQYPPFGEVVDYTENPDGTITLIVDGVWIEKGTDCAFTNTIVVQPFADGTFRYLSNSTDSSVP